MIKSMLYFAINPFWLFLTIWYHHFVLRLKKAVQLINSLDTARFPLLLSRIVQKLHLRVWLICFFYFFIFLFVTSYKGHDFCLPVGEILEPLYYQKGIKMLMYWFNFWLLSFQDERAFSKDEEEKLQAALGLESDDLYIVLETCTFILEQVN